MAKEFDELHTEIAAFLKASRNEFKDPVRLASTEVTIPPTTPKSFTQEFREWASDPISRLFVAALAVAVIPAAVGVVTGDVSLAATLALGGHAAIWVGMGAYSLKQNLKIRGIR